MSFNNYLMIRYFYCTAWAILLLTGFLLLIFSQQEVLASGEISGEMPMQAGLGIMIILLSLSGFIIGALAEFLFFLLKRNRQQNEVPTKK